MRDNNVNDDIFDKSITKKEEYEQKMELKVEQAKHRYQVDDSKKE